MIWISLSNEFDASVNRSLVETKVKTENHLSMFAAVVVDIEIFMGFNKLSFYKQTG